MPLEKSPPMRADIRCPPDSKGDDGQPRGVGGIVLREVPLLDFKTIGSSEPDYAGQQQAISLHSFRIYADPNKPIRHVDYLTGGTLGSRRLNIREIDDVKQNGTLLALICGEEVK